MKKKTALVGVIIGLFLILLAVLFAVPRKTEIHRTIACTDVHTQETVHVVVDGTYYTYFLRDDHFVGSIDVPGKRHCTRDYVWEKDTRSYFVDDYGQPVGTITQYDQFETLSIAENDYVIASN